MCRAQDPEPDVSVFFDDGSIAGGKTLIKFDAASPITGQAAFYLEQVIANDFSLEVGGGPVLPFHFKPLTVDDSYPLIDDADLISGGYSFGVRIQKYGFFSLWNGFEAPEGVHVGFAFRQRKFTLTPGPVVVDRDFYYINGFQRSLGKKFSFDFSYGVGFRLWNADYVLSNDSGVDFIFPIEVKFGYIIL